MDKYIQDLTCLLPKNKSFVHTITGIYKEKEVTKTITETELVLEEI